MKKKIMFLGLICVLCFTGCDKSSKDEQETTQVVEKEKKNNEPEEVLPYEEIMKPVDFTQPHIYAEIKKNLTVDASIPTLVPEDLGLYRYTRKTELSIEEEKVVEENIIKLIDSYYGEDVTLTYAEAETLDKSSQANVTASSTSVRYCDLEEPSDYFRFEYWDEHFPQYESSYDEEMIDTAVQGFLEHFESILPDDISGEYRCVHLNEEYWQIVCDEYSDRALGDFTNTNSDYYMVRLDQLVEQNVYIENEVMLSFAKGDETSWPSDFAGDLEKLSSWNVNSYVDLLIDEEGKVFAFEIQNGLTIGECMEIGEILTVDEVLEMVYDEYAPLTVYEKTVIKDIRLKYVTCLDDEVDETGYRGSHLEPVWSIKFTRKNETYHRTIIYSAISGKVLYIER